ATSASKARCALALSSPLRGYWSIRCRAFEAEVASEARAELEAVLAILDGRAPAVATPPPEALPPTPRSGGAGQRGGKSGR
ncbi:MAG TPA: hypothetical protein VHG35_11345, partial [Gemmatimonadales bacterium]|nr:hypothetical protein [Gemmatimonadales bacterium]